ncbi:hypothetical protein Ga0123461_1723 [Mariprofundus aestuarium]|uniref:Secreted protein n=1 Tax=Mariprofundus aestuarium TaxID=1921086 RepID=A0A2K8L789_MARES|nr:hypothetical protein [Mariprofundus aestuarium]ATX80136.1 hypothetical protein Ga0123461_1723 [Mariprofundus aestuarium]
MKNVNSNSIRFISRIFTVAAIAALTVSNAYASGHTEKVAICHLPPGNPENVQNIEIGEPAVEAHLAHGDILGYCPPSEASTTDTTGATVSSTPSFVPVKVYSMRSIQGQ